MAQGGDFYLPELSKVLTLEISVSSWQFVYHTLSKTTTSNTTDSLEQATAFLNSQTSKKLLERSVPSFGPLNVTSKSHFEARTAAINIPSSTSSHYDIEQVKADALWFSNELKVDEIVALHVVVLEWQRRPSLHLNAGFSDAELASLRSVYDQNTISKSDRISDILISRSDDEFATEVARRRRQILVYFQELIAFTKTWLAFFDMESSPKGESSYGLLPLTNSISSRFDSCLQFLNASIEQLMKGPSWSMVDDDANYLWSIGQVSHLQAVMELVQTCARVNDITSTEQLTKWFELMDETQFLSGVTLGPAMNKTQLQGFQRSVAMTTMSLLGPMSILVNSDSLSELHWLRSADTVGLIYRVLTMSVENNCIHILPIAWMFSFMLKDVQARAIDAREKRDDPYIQRAIEQTATQDVNTGRRSSISSLSQQSLWEDAMEAISAVHPDVSDPAEDLYIITSENGASDVLAQMASFDKLLLAPSIQVTQDQTIQETLILAAEFLGYTPEVLTPQFALLDTRAYMTATPMINGNMSELHPATIFTHNKLLLGQLFAPAAARFPHDVLPFLRLCRLLAHSDNFDQQGTHFITHQLQSLDTFTCAAAGSFASYHTLQEYDNLNLVALDQAAAPYETSSSKSLTYHSNNQWSMVIPGDTQGEMISDVHPPIIKWEFQYSGLALCGRWLDMHYSHQLDNFVSQNVTSQEVAAEIVALLTTLLDNTNRQAEDHISGELKQTALANILDDASRSYNHGNDLVGRIFDILEQELQSFRQRPSNNFDTSLLSACVAFSKAILNIRPSQFWTSITKTSLVNTHGATGQFFAFLVGTESFTGDLNVTRAFTDLYVDAVEAALRRPLVLSTSSKVTPLANMLNNAAKQYEIVLRSFTQTALDIYDTIDQWSGDSLLQRDAIIASISRVCDRILSLRLNFGRGVTPTQLNACFDASASLILTRLRPQTKNDARSGAILGHLLTAQPSKHLHLMEMYSGVANISVARLATTLIRCARVIPSPSSSLEFSLLGATPVLLRQLCTGDQDCVHDAVELLQVLLDGQHAKEPASLLGHVGSQSCISFLDVLCTMCASRITAVQAAAWSVLRCLIGHHQQWLAIVILTGNVPDRTTKERSSSHRAYRGKLLLNIAMDKLSKVSDIEGSLAVSMLNFVICAQRNWSWTIQSSADRKEAFTALARYPSTTETQDLTMKLQITSLITDLWSIRLHYNKATGDAASIEEFLPMLDWLTANAVHASSYNNSMHVNLRKNFQTKFGIQLDNFERSLVLADSTVAGFDLELASLVLSGKPNWSVDGRHTEKSYSAEVRRANSNLAIVEAELLLLRSFQRLCIEHAAFFAEEEPVRLKIVRIIHNCLTANKKPYPGEPIFQNILQERAEMSLALMQHLVQKQKKSGLDYRNLLSVAWDCTMIKQSSYESAIVNDDLLYWRTMLSVVLLALKFHQNGQTKSQNTPTTTGANPHGSNTAELLRRSETPTGTLLEITSVVCSGLQPIVLLLQEAKQSEMRSQTSDQPPSVNEKDVALILHMLEMLLSTSRVAELSTQVAECLLSTGIVQAAIQLYAYSHLLINEETGNQPIYAEPAMRILALCSTLPSSAEEIAIEGVLSRVLTSRVTQVLQGIPDGVSNIDRRQHCSILYRLWTEGILPMCLNLLHGVHGLVVAEISLFLNQFPHQLNRASRALTPRPENFLTLSLAREIAALSLISFILDTYRSAGASAAVDPSTILPLVGFHEHRKSIADQISEYTGMTKTDLKAKIVPTSEKELTWYQQGTLVHKVLEELKSAATCLRRDEDLDESH